MESTIEKDFRGHSACCEHDGVRAIYKDVLRMELLNGGGRGFLFTANGRAALGAVTTQEDIEWRIQTITSCRLLDHNNDSRELRWRMRAIRQLQSRCITLETVPGFFVAARRTSTPREYSEHRARSTVLRRSSRSAHWKIPKLKALRNCRGFPHGLYGAMSEILQERFSVLLHREGKVRRSEFWEIEAIFVQ